MDKRFVKIILGYGAVIFGIVAFITMLCDVVGYRKVSFSGMDIMFGCRRNGMNVLNFNIVAVIAYLLPLVGAILTAVALAKNKDVLGYVAGGLMVLGAILIFLIPNYWCLFADGQENKTYLKLLEVEYLIGGTLGAIFSLLGGVSIIIRNLIKANV